MIAQIAMLVYNSSLLTLNISISEKILSTIKSAWTLALSNSQIVPNYIFTLHVHIIVLSDICAVK